MMKQEQNQSEKGLLWSAFVFAIMAAAMVVLPYLATWVAARQSANPQLGGAAFGMTFGLIMMAFGAFSWAGSLVMLTVNVFTNRRALRSKVGITTVILDLGVLAYAIFFVSLIAGDLF